MTGLPIEERLAIQDVLTRYAAGVDDRDLAMYRACFADDAVILGFGGGPVTGADAWLAEVRSKLAAFESTQHMLGPQLVTIDGDRATTRTDVQALHYLKDKPGTTLTLWATYFTEYRKQGGDWLIQRHELVRRGSREQSN